MAKLALSFDVSKDSLDFYTLNAEGQIEKGVICNAPIHISSFLKKYSNEDYFLVAEPTGTYSASLFSVASQLDYELRLVNPQKSSQYTQALGIIQKTDAKAAYILFQMGCNKDLKLPVYQAPSKTIEQRKEVQMAIQAFQKQQRMLSNQIHALQQKPEANPLVLESYQRALQSIEQELEQLQEQLLDISDDQVKQFHKYAQSVTGIGPKTANLLLIYTNGLTYFDHKNQLPKFLGTVPYSHYSGTSVKKKGHITKAGPSDLRACLYMAANSAKKFNHACKALYERLRRNGKAHKVAMIAVINKLLHQIFAVVKSQTLFDNERYLKNLA